VRILLTGRNGMVGWELERSLAPLGQVFAFERASLDLAKPDQIVTRVREVRPDMIVNAAAYTAVDQAESEREQAFLVNAAGPGFLAAEAKTAGALLIQYSTDYVFDGTKEGPYVEDDTPNPINVYGESKLAGERAVQASGCRYLILRTSWVYGARGKNFLLTILRLAGERAELRVVDDQVGAPTWCRDIAAVTARLAGTARARDEGGLFHMTAAGATSWCGFARAILKARGIETPVQAISTADYPTPATRPANSLLASALLADRYGLRLREWRASLHDCLSDRTATRTLPKGSPAG